jgi:hypothetical protein
MIGLLSIVKITSHVYDFFLKKIGALCRTTELKRKVGFSEKAIYMHDFDAHPGLPFSKKGEK